MEKSAVFEFVFVDDGVGRGFDEGLNLESFANAFDKLSFAGTKLSLEGDD